LQALATLAVRNPVSRGDTVELCSELFGARILTRAAVALGLPY